MKKLFTLFWIVAGILFLCNSSSFAQITVSGSVGIDGTYTSFTNASGVFATLNGSTQTGANITITITGDVTTEAGTNSLNAGAWTSILIQPSGARTISGTVAGAPLINFNGADNVTINGLNTGGNSLTISNLSASATSGTTTIKYIADATNNTITNCTILGSETAPLATNGGVIFISTGTTTGNDNITISNCNIGPAGTNLPSKLIYGNGSTTNATVANSNITINNCNLYDYFLTSGCAAVYALTGNTDWNVTNNKIYQTASRTFTAAGTMYGIYFSNSTYGNNIQITGNTIGYASSSATGTLTLLGAVAGVFQGIYLNAMTTAANACNINNNIVSDISLTSSTGAFYGIQNATGASSNTININTNQVKNITLITTTGSGYGIAWGSATNMTLNGNNVYNLTRNGAGSLYGIYSGSSSTNETVTNNNVYNLSATSATTTSTIYGIYQGTATGTKVFQNNNIYNLTGSYGNTIYGLSVSYGATVDISVNNIYALSTTSGTAGAIYGIYSGTTATTMNIYKNKIYNLSAGNSNPIVDGIFIAGGTTRYIYNNYVSDLRTPTANANLPVVGLYISGGTTVSAFYNTIFLNATSSGTNFGSAAIYASTTPTVDLRNNVFVNTSSPNGTGFTTAYYRSTTTLTTYASTSNNNCFYSGTPGTNRVIYYDNTNNDQTIAAYKTRVATRDASSFTENPPFINVATTPYDLHINTLVATQLESGGTPVSTPIAITTDFDGDTRNASTPDVGADEFTGTGLDLTPPVISYTALPHTQSTTARTLTATITDAGSGVPQSGIGLPVLYWKINATGTYAAATGSWVAGNTYSFTFGAGVVMFDSVFYYICAQDNAAAQNTTCYPSTGASGFTPNPPTASTPPTTPSKYYIANSPLSGDYTVGAAVFNKITGKNITFQKVIKKVLVEETIEDKTPENNSQITKTEKGKNEQNQTADNSEKTTSSKVKGKTRMVEVEKVEWIPMENGKEYTGDLFVKKNQNPGLNYPNGVNGVYLTLTAAINDLNMRGVGGATRFLLVDASYTTGETYPLNVNINNDAYMPTASNTVTIKPSTGITATISGAMASGPIFKIQNSYVTIDGSNTNGGTSRDLTITNTSTTGPQVILIGSTGTTPITNVSIKNNILINGSNGSSALVVTDIAGTAGYFNNITVQNNSIQKAYIGVYFWATATTGNGSGTLITGNDLNTSGANSILLIGVYVQGVDGATVSNNNIGNMSTSGAYSPKAIWFATGTNSGTISGNNINSMTLTNTGAYALTGIYVNPGATATSINITSNTVSTLANSGTTLAYAGILSFSPNTNITNNTVSNLTQNAAYAFWGIVQSGAVNSNCTGNTVYGITTATSGVANGINIQGLSTGVNISRNKIYNIKNTNSGGYTAVALALSSSSTTANITVSNNIIYDVAGYGWASQTTDNGYGINIYSGGGYNLYYNSINMATNQSYATGAPACLIINSAVTTANTLDIRNNIFSHPATIGSNRYCILSNAANTVFSNINYNDYYTSGTNIGYIGATDITNLAAWQTATGKDGNSVSGDPKFLSATDLHIDPNVTSPVHNAGTPITGITIDYDGETRNVSTPDIGADEYTFIVPAVEDPTAFTATASTSSQINLVWTNNGNNDNVVLAYNTTNTFGTPDPFVPLNPGDPIPGGGTVLYFGMDGNFSHSPLTENTTYYYKAWSCDPSYQYSNGITTSATTPCGSISTFPYTQDFEAVSIGCWTTGILSGTANDWARGTPSGKTQITAPHGGTKCFVTNLTGATYQNSQNSYVKTPVFNFSSLVAPKLKFWSNFYTESGWDAGIVEYSTNGGTSWRYLDSALGTGTNYNTTNSSNWYNSSSTSGPIGPYKFSGGSTAYTGHSSGWIQSTSDLTFLAGQSSVQFRFRFGSDASGNSYDGWAFDDFSISEPGIDVGPLTIGQSGSMYFKSGTTNIPMTGVVKNFSASTQSFVVTRTIAGTGYSSTQSVTTLAPGATANVTFADFTGFTTGTAYTIKDSTYLATDIVPSNDTLSKVFTPNIAKVNCVYWSDAASRDSLIACMTNAGMTSADYDILSTASYTGSLRVWSTVWMLFGSGGSWTAAQRDTLKAFLDNSDAGWKKTLVVFGNDLGYNHDRIGSSYTTTADSTFYRYYLKSHYLGDSWLGLTPSPTGKFKGSPDYTFPAILSDSCYDPYPDYVVPVNGGASAFIPLNRANNTDTVNAVYYAGTTWNMFYGTNIFSGYRTKADGGKSPTSVFYVIMNWINMVGGTLPVEMTAFNSSVIKNNVTLKWTTATETNNKAFEIERKSANGNWTKVGNIQGSNTKTTPTNYTFEDKKLNAGKYNYRLKQIDVNGNYRFFNLNSIVEVGVPKSFSLSQNYPNPFNPVTKIDFELPFDSKVKMVLYDILGREVKVLVPNELKQAGFYTMEVNALNLASGTYFYRMVANSQNKDFVFTKKMVVVK